MSLFFVVYLSIIGTTLTTNENYAKDHIVDLHEAIVQIENLIEELSKWCDNLNNARPSIRSKYYGFSYGNEGSLNFLDVKRQRNYLQLLMRFIEVIHSKTISDSKMMQKMGQRFIMYNELLEAIEKDADEILRSSSISIFTRQVIAEKESRYFLKMALKLFLEEDFYAENLTNRQGIQSAIIHISSKSKAQIPF